MVKAPEGYLRDMLGVELEPLVFINQCDMTVFQRRRGDWSKRQRRRKKQIKMKGHARWMPSVEEKL